MNLLARCVNAIRRLDEAALSMKPRLRLGPEVAARLAQAPLVVADVGAAGEPDPRWAQLGQGVRYVTFEPRAGTAVTEGLSVNFPVALGAAKGTKRLHLAKFADSSSLYPMNTERMKDFAVGDLLETVGELPVEMMTLDDCLAKAPELSPTFLKLDVEGAELDVLKGGERALATSVLSQRVEVSFVARHLGAPLFGEVDAFLRARGFEIFGLSRELMMRRNLQHMPFSQPQLVWGDATYFVTATSFFQRVSGLPPEQREQRLVHFVVVLVLHWVHDYALEMVERAEVAQLASPALTKELRALVQYAARGSVGYASKAILGTALASVIYLGVWPARGARRFATFYWKRRMGYLVYFLWRLTARGGERNAGVSDGLL